MRRRCTALTLAAALLAPSASGAAELRTFDVATGARAIVASSPTLEWNGTPCWTLDGQLVGLEYRSTRWSVQRRYVLYARDGRRVALGSASGFESHVSFAPGCARIAEMRRRLPGGGTGALLREPAGRPLGILRSHWPVLGPFLAWSPDGSLVADVDDSALPRAVRVADAATGHQTARTALDRPRGRVGDGAFSPDGSGVVFTEWSWTRGLGRVGQVVRILDLRSGRARDLLHVDASIGVGDVAWSPRGDLIAVVLDGRLHLLDVAGHDLGAVAPDARVGRIAWSPDGSLIAFVHRRTRPHWSSTLAVVAARPGAPASFLHRGDGQLSRPAWSPDGRRIAVAGGT